ncbi:cysteine hydrolase family protein [Dehalobacterium formicoaceticum]|uniref:Cysteine hydrolase family protein n=1 Tax=Dehalobacterium formicoaceticum TaxID=51515 RepID=A0ABT1Y975_9FIRM|nr:cysteine hydrolase family protein [Dehalobacterium formicoaceticum]MCR6546655.1 cysteine hydrolase family protein [Dehalobacterium formicoaceticum]
MNAYFDNVKKPVTDKILQDLYLDANKTAVITIDMYNGHLSEDPDCPCPALRGREIIEPINNFTAACRELEVPVIHVRSTLRKDGSDDIKGNISAWRLVFPMTVGPIPGIEQHALEGSKWTEFAVDVRDSDYIVNGKKRLSAFYPTDLELLLRNLHKETIVLLGAMTDCCVLNTAFDGANRDFRIVLPQDLTRGSEHLEEAACRIVSLHLGLVVDSSELLEEWRNQKSKR